MNKYIFTLFFLGLTGFPTANATVVVANILVKKDSNKKVKKSKPSIKKDGWNMFDFYENENFINIGGNIYVVLRNDKVKSENSNIQHVTEFMFVQEKEFKKSFTFNKKTQLMPEMVKDAIVLSQVGYYKLLNNMRSLNDGAVVLEALNSLSIPFEVNNKDDEKNKYNGNTYAVKIKEALDNLNLNDEMENIVSNYAFGVNGLDFKFMIEGEDSDVFKFYEYMGEALYSENLKDYYLIEISDNKDNKFSIQNPLILLPRSLLSVDGMKENIIKGLSSFNENMLNVKDLNNNFVLSVYENNSWDENIVVNDLKENFNEIKGNYINLIKSSLDLYPDKKEVIEDLEPNIKISYMISNIDNVSMAIFNADTINWKNPLIVKNGKLADYYVLAPYNEFKKDDDSLKVNLSNAKFFHKDYLKFISNPLFLSAFDYIDSLSQKVNRGDFELRKINYQPKLNLDMVSNDFRVSSIFSVDRIRKTEKNTYIAYIPSIIGEPGKYHEVEISNDSLLTSKFNVSDNTNKENPSHIKVYLDLLLLGHYGDIRKKQIF